MLDIASVYQPALARRKRTRGFRIAFPPKRKLFTLELEERLPESIKRGDGLEVRSRRRIQVSSRRRDDLGIVLGANSSPGPGTATWRLGVDTSLARSFADTWATPYDQAMPVSFTRVAPVLPVRNVVEALDRYRRLGFQARPYLEPDISTEEDPIYGYLTWGSVEIHLSGFDQLDPKTTTSVCYLFVDDADAVYAAWSAAGVEGRFRPPAATSYGKREFGYVDPDGNLLRVGSSI
jgi:hypothetical protein